MKHTGKLAKLIDMAVKDGEITPLENNVLLKATAEQGVDPEELAMVVNTRLKEIKSKKKANVRR